MPTTRPRLPDAASALLEQQNGAIARRQALPLGLTDSFLRSQVAARRWRSGHVGVYVDHCGELSEATTVWVALLRAGVGATASHLSAAHLDGLVDEQPALVTVTLPIDRRVRGDLAGIDLRYATRIAESRHPARTPPRTRVEDTVLDLVDGATSVRPVVGWVTAACQRRLTTFQRLSEALASRKKIRWRAEVEAVVGDVGEDALSPLEVRYLRNVERPHGLPRGVRNGRRRAGRRVIWVDVDLPDYRLRIELDGRTGHVEEGAFRDRRRDNAATVGGESTLRYGYVEVLGTPCDVALEVTTVLSARGWTERPRPCSYRCPLRAW